MTRATWLISLLGLLAVSPAALADAPEKGRVWEINGIRLDADQVERLADDMAERTVKAVEEKVEGIELRDEQRPALRDVYRRVSLDVYDEVVRVVADETLSDAVKEDRVRELVLAGQKRSHGLLAPILDERQLALYTRWEDGQVEAFRSKRWEKRRRRRRR